MCGVPFSPTPARRANEGLIKLARKYSFDKYGKGRGTIITLNNSFHGRTITTLSATGQDVFHNYFFPFTEGFRHADANDLDSVGGHGRPRCVRRHAGADPGRGRRAPPGPGVCPRAWPTCAPERDWLLLVDEVQTGVGRTGTLFAFQQYGIQPDAVSFAKGIAGGLPFGGVMAGEKCRDVLTHRHPRHHLRRQPHLPRPPPATCWTSWMDDAMFQSVTGEGGIISGQPH